MADGSEKQREKSIHAVREFAPTACPSDQSQSAANARLFASSDRLIIGGRVSRSRKRVRRIHRLRIMHFATMVERLRPILRSGKRP
jgi:hypothetical protein